MKTENSSQGHLSVWIGTGIVIFIFYFLCVSTLTKAINRTEIML